MSVHQVDHLDLTVRDLEESIAWYSEIFGFHVVERGERPSGPWAIIRSGEALLCIYEAPLRKPPSRYLRDGGERHVVYHFGLRISGRTEWLQTVEKHQLELEFGGEAEYPHSSSWYVADPTGYSIEVVIWNENRIQFDDLLAA